MDVYGARLLKFVASLSCLAVFAASAASSQQSEAEELAFEVTFPSMGTLVSLKTFGDDEAKVEEVFKATRAEIDRLAMIFTDYDEESETRKLTEDDRIGKWQKVSPELWELLNVADEWNRRSEGAFDVSIGRLSVLWRTARSKDRIPTAAQIAEALKYCGWKHVELDASNQSVCIHLQGLRLDFGAVAKGYVIERAYQMLAAKGYPSSLVRAGGDLRCGAAPPGRDGWRIEIENVDDMQSKRSGYVIANAAISSSGDRYQFIEIEGKRRSHVIDPRTGVGVEGPMLVTVIAATSTEADAADTAICVMGHEAGMKLAKLHPELKVRIVSRIPEENSGAGAGKERVSQQGFEALVPIK